jgi:Flp pilus assembly protein TadD
VSSFEQYARYCEKSADAQQLLGGALLRTGQAAKARDAYLRCAELGDGTPVGADCKKSGEQLR